MLSYICRSSGRNVEETALLINGDRFVNPALTLVRALQYAHYSFVASGHVVVQWVALPRPIKTVTEMLDVFCKKVEQAQDRPRVSFDKVFDVRMEGEFFAHINGPPPYPPGTIDMQMYKSDGSIYCANVSKRASTEAQWILDGRPVFFKVKSFGAFSWRVNPTNGHLTICTCSYCPVVRE